MFTRWPFQVEGTVRVALGVERGTGAACSTALRSGQYSTMYTLSVASASSASVFGVMSTVTSRGLSKPGSPKVTPVREPFAILTAE